MERFCDKCGTLVSGEGTFCPNCGAVLEGAVNLDKPNTASSETAQPNYGQPAQMNYGQFSQPSYGQSNMQNNQAQMPVYPQTYNNNPSQQPVQNMSVGSWVGTIIISCLGLIGLIFLFIWAFDGSTIQPKKNFARGMLIVYAIMFALAIFINIVFVASCGAFFDSLGYYNYY